MSFNQLCIALIISTMAVACTPLTKDKPEKVIPNQDHSDSEPPQVTEEAPQKSSHEVYPKNSWEPSQDPRTYTVRRDSEKTEKYLSLISSLNLSTFLAFPDVQINLNEKAEYFVPWRCSLAVNKLSKAPKENNLFQPEIFVDLCDSSDAEITLVPGKLIRRKYKEKRRLFSDPHQKITEVQIGPNNKVIAYQVMEGDVLQTPEIRGKQFMAKNRLGEYSNDLYGETLTIQEMSGLFSFSYTYQSRSGRSKEKRKPEFHLVYRLGDNIQLRVHQITMQESENDLQQGLYLFLDLPTRLCTLEIVEKEIVIYRDYIKEKGCFGGGIF